MELRYRPLEKGVNLYPILIKEHTPMTPLCSDGDALGSTPLLLREACGMHLSAQHCTQRAGKA